MISENQRTINVIARALAYGFEFNSKDAVRDILPEAEHFLISCPNILAIEEICQVEYKNRKQRVDYADGMGYTYWCEGDILRLDEHQLDAPGTLLLHSSIVNSQGDVVRLFHKL